jgi:predicted Rossmann fold nucleotide-binding protein DprA/Smf involved in DNA uptake
VVSKGTLQLIKEGAEIATCAKDILNFYRAENNFQKSSPPNTRVSETSEVSQVNALRSPSKGSDTPQKIQGSDLEKKIIEHLQNESLGIDELSQLLGVSASELGVALSMLQLRGLISQEGTKYYIDK